MDWQAAAEGRGARFSPVCLRGSEGNGGRRQAKAAEAEPSGLGAAGRRDGADEQGVRDATGRRERRRVIQAGGGRAASST